MAVSAAAAVRPAGSYLNWSRKICQPPMMSKLFLGPTQTQTATQTATISGRALRDPGKESSRPAPFPYKTKKFGYFQSLIDDTLKRFDDNTKIVVVEGNIASGKSAFAKQLAEQLDMLYMPEATMDMFYVNSYGYDLRQLDDQLPDRVKSFDVKQFYEKPNHISVGNFQILLYRNRFRQYADALCHLFNTGQGVVLERCAYSDSVFLETMFQFGYVSKGVRNAYIEIKENTIGELMKPHLVIYLDVPSNILLDRVKKRGRSYEVNSKVMTKEYLDALEANYKQKYIKEISQHAELLVYDWSNYGDVEVVVEDIERIQFDGFDKYDPKMKDWRLYETEEWIEKRHMYTGGICSLMQFFNIPQLFVPELTIPADEFSKWKAAWENAPGNKYTGGFNSDVGDKGLLFKNKIAPRTC